MALVVLSPLLLITVLFIKINLGSPVIFKQQRPGKDEKIFNIYKFRSMTDATADNGELLPDKDRLTKFGKLLRKTSIDELPELINILKGDMSIVGPRPLLMSYLSVYTDFQKRRHEVKPGLSGLAQINGRNMIKWEDKFKLDIKYVDNINFLGDCIIVIKTIIQVIKRNGINKEGCETTERFDVVLDKKIIL